MAEETKKSTKATKVKIEEPKNDSNKEIVAMLKKMQSELDSLKKENKELKESETKEKAEKIDSEEEIEVMSLFAGQMSLYTEGFGNGSKYYFEEGYGSVIDIPFGDLKLIVKNNNKISKDGYFYILNEDAISQLRLKKAYEKLLSIDLMENISKKSDDKVIAIYKSASESQKELIITYFDGKYLNGEDVSHGLLYDLGVLCGKNLLEK